MVATTCMNTTVKCKMTPHKFAGNRQVKRMI